MHIPSYIQHFEAGGFYYGLKNFLIFQDRSGQATRNNLFFIVASSKFLGDKRSFGQPWFQEDQKAFIVRQMLGNLN
jgi:hypothetical protein